MRGTITGMLRWLALVLAVGLASAPAADAQVFKPKTKKATPEKAEKSDKADAPKKSSASEKKAATKQARTEPTKKKVASKSKKKSGAEAAPKESDKDFVEITDDESIE